MDNITKRTNSSNFEQQFEHISGLKQWKLWLTLLSLACVLVAFAQYLDFANNSESNDNIKYLNIGIYSVLLGFGFVTMYLSFKEAVFIEQQSTLASIQVDQLRQLNDVSLFIEQAEKAYLKIILNPYTKFFSITVK